MEGVARSIVRPQLDIPLAIRRAKVISVNWPDFTCTIRLDGSDSPEDDIEAKWIESYLPVVNQYVWYLKDEDDRLIVGPVGARGESPRWPNKTEISRADVGIVGGDPPLQSWPPQNPCSATIRKFYDNSQLLVDARWNGWTHYAGPFFIGIKVNGNDWAWQDRYSNTPATHFERSFATRIVGLGAGLHTITLAARGSGGNIQCDGFDRQTLIIEEILPNET